MNEKEKNIIYTAGDIQKYLQGQMTTAEMHAIEKAALDDPLLAEAIEGYASVEEKDWSKGLAELKNTFNKKETAPVIPIAKTSFAKWWKAAAAVLVVGTSVTVAYLFSGNNNSSKQTTEEVAVADSMAATPVDSAVAINEKKDSVSTGAFVNTNAATANGTVSIPQTSTESIVIAEVKPQKETEGNGFIYKPSPQPASTVNDAAKDMAATDETIKQNAEEAPAAKKLPSLNNTNAETNEAELDKNAAAQTQGYYKKEINNNNFNAQVVTEDNKPVAFAQVNVPKSKKGIYTDANGNFKVSAPDTAVDVVVTSVGYTAKKYKLQNSAAQNKIVLQPDEKQLAETVVVGKKRDVRKKEVKDTLNTGADDEEEDEDAEPEIGWSEYNNYLNNNLVIPGEAREKNIHGVVEVFVNLSRNGSIKEIKVDKPLCAGCDAEAIRLIKEGPKWDVKSKKPAKVKVKVTF